MGVVLAVVMGRHGDTARFLNNETIGIAGLIWTPEPQWNLWLPEDISWKSSL